MNRFTLSPRTSTLAQYQIRRFHTAWTQSGPSLPLAAMPALAPKATLPAGRETGWSGWFSAVHSLSLNIPWAVALSQVGHAAASFRDIPADPPRLGQLVWRPTAIAAQELADSEPGLQIEDA